MGGAEWLMVDYGISIDYGAERQAHSSRNTITGSMRVALRAGISIADSATPANKMAVMA
jgi:hypothetical protein